jgi:hypothetical protein
LLELAGIKSTVTLTIDDLWEARSAHIAADLMLHGGGQAKLAFDASALGADGQPAKAVMVRGASIAGEAISYAVEVEFGPKDGEPGTYVSRAFRPLEVRRAVRDVNDYLEELAGRFGHKVMIHPDGIVEVEPGRFDLSWGTDN